MEKSLQATGLTEESQVQASLATVPEYLRTSRRYAILAANYTAEETLVFPKDAFKADLNLSTRDDVARLVLTLQYWEAEVPDELRAVCFSDPELVIGIVHFLKPFMNPLPALTNMLSATRTRPEDRMYHAAGLGDLGTIKYLRSIGSQWNHRECCIAAHHGQLQCLQYTRENGCAWTDGMPQAECACYFAARAGHLACLEYAHQHGCPQHCEFLVAPCRWKMDCLQYVLDHDFPIATKPVQTYQVLRDLTAQVGASLEGTACMTSLQRRCLSCGPNLQALARQEVQRLRSGNSLQSPILGHSNMAQPRRPPPANSLLGNRNQAVWAQHQRLQQHHLVGATGSDTESDEDVTMGSPSTGRLHHRHPRRRLPEDAGEHRQMPRIQRQQVTAVPAVLTDADTRLQHVRELVEQRLQEQQHHQQQQRLQVAASRRQQSGIQQSRSWYDRTPKYGQRANEQWGTWPGGK